MTAPSIALSPAVPSRAVLRWLLAALPALPLSILLHEAGHFLVFSVTGFSEVTLHFAGVTHAELGDWVARVRGGDLAAAARLAPAASSAWAIAAGLAVTYGSCLAIILAARRGPLAPWVAALGIATPVRFLFGLSSVPLLLRGTLRTSGTDEGLFAALVGIPELAFWSLGFLVTAITWVTVVRSIPPAHRWSRLASMIAGLAIGTAIYFSWLGPTLLP
jgi:hypothetical protein